MMRLFLFCGFAVIAAQAWAGNTTSHRDVVAETAFSSIVAESKVNRDSANQFHIGRQYQINTRFADMFNRQSLFSKSSNVASNNIGPLTYEMRRVYSMNAPRYSFILNLVNKPGQVFSIGYDWGRDANQHPIKPSLFLGLTHGMSFNKSDALVFSLGRWFGGKTPENFCDTAHVTDTLCNLLEMSGVPADNRSVTYFDVKYLYRF